MIDRIRHSERPGTAETRRDFTRRRCSARQESSNPATREPRQERSP